MPSDEEGASSDAEEGHEAEYGSEDGRAWEGFAMTGTQAPHPSTHVVLDVGLTVGAGAALPSIDDFSGSASVPGGAAHKRDDFSHKHAQPASAHRAPGRDAARGDGGGAPARPDSLVWMDVALATWRGRVEGRKGKHERTGMQRQVTAWLKAGYVKLPRGVTACMCAKKVINILDHPKNAPQIRSYVSLSLLLCVCVCVCLSFSLFLSLSLFVYLSV